MKQDKHILFLGKRLEAIRAAKKLGLSFSVIQNKVPQKQRKYFEVALPEDSDFFETALKKMPQPATHVIPVTEYGVRIYDRIVRSLKLKNTITPFIKECFNKSSMKDFAKRHEIPITDYLYLEKWNAKTVTEKLGTDIVIKQVASSGSRGQTFMSSIDQIRDSQIQNAIVEKRIYGKEFSIESFVKNGKIIFTNFTDYHTHHICNVLPSVLDGAEDALTLNQKIITTFQIQTAMTHIEFYKTPSGILFGEIAIRPPGGYIMSLLDLAYGFSSWETLLKLYIDASVDLPKQPNYFTACWILHPGQGNLLEAPDFTNLQDDPSFYDLKNALQIGRIQKRGGSGEDYGRIILKNEDFNKLLKSIENIKNNLAYRMS